MDSPSSWLNFADYLGANDEAIGRERQRMEQESSDAYNQAQGARDTLLSNAQRHLAVGDDSGGRDLMSYGQYREALRLNEQALEKARIQQRHQTGQGGLWDAAVGAGDSNQSQQRIDSLNSSLYDATNAFGSSYDAYQAEAAKRAKQQTGMYEEVGRKHQADADARGKQMEQDAYDFYARTGDGEQTARRYGNANYSKAVDRYKGEQQTKHNYGRYDNRPGAAPKPDQDPYGTHDDDLSLFF